MRSWYNDDLRNQIAGTKKDTSAGNIEHEGAFFKAFRNFETTKEKLYSPYEKNIYYKKYKWFVEKETKSKADQIESIENLIEYHKFFLRWERKVNRAENANDNGSTSATRYRVDQINELEEELEKLLEISPEAWEFYYSRQLIDDIEAQREQRLVDVAYVAGAKEKIINSLEMGVPVYLVGHLGSGKTQLATEAALEFSIRNRIQKELETELTSWFEDNTDATEKDAILKFKELNSKKSEYYKNLLIHGGKDEIESLHPLFISGSHNLTYEDMFVEKTLTLGQSFSHKSYSEYLDMIIGDFYDWMDTHRDKLQEMTEEEQLQLKIQIWKSFSDLLVANNSAFGTEIKKTEKEILRAVKEGRPVIVDELNTIAMQNLISLNDILQRHAGSTAYITGVGPVVIQPGFAFIGTGNLSTQRVSYEGTNVLNPAFKSRFVTIEYNYVSQNIKGSLSEQISPDENELFRIIITRLTDEQGNLHLPDSKRSVEEVFRFAQLSRVTQNVFMGKWEDNDQENDIDQSELELRESVLSIRNILHVLDSWNSGEQKDLSKAIWDGFLSSITYADDQNYILSQAVRFGFFAEEDGWKVVPKGMGETTTTYSEIRTRPYKYSRAKTDAMSYLDIVHMLFGKGVERKTYPKELQVYFGIDESDEPEISVDEYQEIDSKLAHLEHSKFLLENLEDIEG